MIFLYRALFLPLLLLSLPYYLLRMCRRGGYAKDFSHRFGFFTHLPAPKAEIQRIWLQAVSVGEVLAIAPLINALQDHKDIEIVLTTTTSTAYAQARKKYTSTVLEFKAKGDTFLAQSFYHILLGDWISVYLAELNEVDDVEVKVIDFLKAELAKI